MPELKELKPLKLPGEKDPTQAISTCPKCNSCVDQKSQQCQNCGETIVPQWGNPHPRKVPGRVERYEEYGPKNLFITPTVKVHSLIVTPKTAKKKKDKDHAEHDEDTVRDEYLSDEVRMCLEPKQENTDKRKEEIMRSCQDLAIDG